MPPGDYLLQFTDGATINFQVPVQPTRLYIGTVRSECRDPARAGCRPGDFVGDAGAAVPVPGTATTLATPYDAAASLAGWPTPSRIAVQVARAAWENGVEGRVSAGTGGAMAGGGVGIALIGLNLGFALAVPTGGLGLLVSVPFLAAGAGMSVLGLVVAGGEEISAARQRSNTPCLESLAAQLAPPALEPRLAGSFAEAPLPRVRRERLTSAPEWQVSVTRLVLRHCAGTNEYGLEVASRWRSAGREADFVRIVAGTREHPARRRPAPWEIAAPTDAPCRPFARYCEPDGPDLLRQDVNDALTAARDAIAAGR